MNLDYRSQARSHLQSAKEELNAGFDQRLKFGALELRMAMECLTYDRALAYKDEFPPNEYETWQPRKVMLVLLEIDETADKDSALSVGIEEMLGVPASMMKSLGSERVLNMNMLKKHYDALGSYLHVPTMKQALGKVPLDLGKMRSRCDEIVTYLDAVLASPIFNITFGNFATMDCLKCGKRIRKRLPDKQMSVDAACFGCDASYTITKEGDDKVVWHPHQQPVKCAKPDCADTIYFWTREVKVGLKWTCPSCKGSNEVGLALEYVAPSEGNT